MRTCLFIFILSAGVFVAYSQKPLSFKTGDYYPVSIPEGLQRQDTIQYLFYHSDYVLTTPERTVLLEQGVEILYTLQDQHYWVRIYKAQEENIRRKLYTLPVDYKRGTALDNRSTSRRFRLSIAPGMKKDEVTSWALQNGITLLDIRSKNYGFIDVDINSSNAVTLLNTPWIFYIGIIPQDEEIQYRGQGAERGRGLTSPLTRGLDGSGITVGIGDGGRLGLHEDLSSSILDLTSFSLSNHATQVSGIITGAGLIDPFFGYGYAPKANIVLRNFSDILWDAPQYMDDFGLSLTNNSYGAGLTDCVYFGDYDGTSAGLDAMMYDRPHLLHVFAAANSGNMTCEPYPFRYATIAGGYQPAKNVLTVGAISNTDGNATFSSRGPVEDGRIKPEVVACGLGRFSTKPNNEYGSDSGTSFSSPATTGIATLLYERYRQLHNDSLPDAALIKNVLCNAADDLGNVGPDFTFGFGRINGVRSAEILESGRYASVLVDHQDEITSVINIPAGVAFADVMILWTDPPSAPFETVTLVNDLDMVVITPAGDSLRPWKLNHTPSGVALAATTGTDHTNNYEQITIPAPMAGAYTILIKGYRVPLGPQKAWLSWDFCFSGITVQFPLGGEVIKPGNGANDQQYIRWDAFGTGTSTFHVEYSTNAGTDWNTIANNIPSDRRYQGWFPPNIPTDQLLIRVSASNGMSDVSDQPAVIMAAPGNLNATTPCNGYVQLSWNAVPGADYYQVYTIKNETLQEADTTSATSIVLNNFPWDSAVWVSVSGVFSSGVKGLRVKAIQVTANGGNNCPWDHDLRLDSLLKISTGRLLTSSALSSAEPVIVRITNGGMLDASGFSLAYTVNNNSPVFENYPGTLNAGAGQNFTFSTPADLSIPGSYRIKVWVSYASDPFQQNDTLIYNVRQLPNQAITLPWSEGFEGSPDTMVVSDLHGLPVLDGWDINLQQNARLRTFAGLPFCHSGSRAFTVDAIRSGTSKKADVTLTLNMSSYTVANDDLRLNVYAMHHEIIPDEANTEAIWIRGSDTDPFVLLSAIPNEAVTRGLWQHLPGLELTTVLNNAGQDFSSSFQIKFSHDVYATAGQLNSQDGQTIDDLSIYRVEGDATIVELLHPETIACGLGMEAIMIEVANSSTLPVTNTSVMYQLNGGTVHTTFIGAIPPESSVPVQLTPDADFSAPGLYHLKMWVTSPDDDFHFNDTMIQEVLHSSFVNTFPYFEGFEDNDGGWISGGVHSTWEYGVPGKQIISRAAEGQFLWTTALTGAHAADEMSYLYSPCFDLEGLVQPYLSFGFQFQLEVGYDYAWVEYRLEGSDQWVKLGTQGSGVNWYNDASHRWNGNRLSWLTTGIPIPVTDTTIQFRWVMQSDVGVEFEGLAIDQVHVYDRLPIYSGGNMQWTFPVSGSEWVHLVSAGQRIFSIDPSGQDLGDVTLNIYASGNNFHLADSLYLLSRNWVLSSSLPVNNDIRLRAYFTKEEAGNLVNATGCSQCISARDGFDVAALRYSGNNEDGNFSNNNSGQVIAYSLEDTHVVPYDNGYYAEWETSGLSEWWVTSSVTKWSGSIERRISSTNDDAEEHAENGAVNPVREKLSLTEHNGNQKLGWRFKNITVPKGSYISSARMKWMASDTTSTPAAWTLQSEMSPDALPFITSKYNISLRSHSGQVVEWAPAAWSITDMYYDSPDIRHLIQQVVDQASWVNGNDMVFIMSGDGWREAWSYDGDPVKGAQLMITYDSVCLATGICYVDQAANGIQDGSSWANAYRSLEQALDRATHCPGITQIWMAGGFYSPHKDAGRNAMYLIPAGLSIYGGFEGIESSTSERVYGAFPTTVSGDVGTPGFPDDNLYHVVFIADGPERVLLDGVTIKDGRANGVTPDLQKGSGIFNLGNLSVNQVIIQDCSPFPHYNGPGAVLTAGNTFEVRE